MWTEYRRAYRDCADWLARYVVPWRWYLDTYDACQQLRQAAATMAPGAPVPGTVAVPAWTERGGTPVPRPTVQPAGMIDRFRFSPGDGHVYVWPITEGDEVIHVRRITSTDPWITADTGDRIDVSGVARTAESMRAAVVLWKARQGVTA